MAKHYLSPLFTPRSIAVIGQGADDTLANTLLSNIREGGFDGKVYAVNTPGMEGVPEYRKLEELGAPVDLAMLTTQTGDTIRWIQACGRNHIGAAAILSSGFVNNQVGLNQLRQILDAAKLHQIPILGPSTLGIMRPALKLNALYSRSTAHKGSMALVSQSGALCTAMLDWAKANDIGFSSVITVGDAEELDFGAVLDFLVSDPQTESILLYIEAIRNVRSFMSALRAATRIKPVIVVKAGRQLAGCQAVINHINAPVGNDLVFASALRRAGAVRVETFVQLFSAAKALASRQRPHGNRLAIISNGGGPGVIAADRATDVNVRIAPLAEATLENLNQIMPKRWSQANPIDIPDDGSPERLRSIIKACMDDPNIDGVLGILTPQANTDATNAAQVLIDASKEFGKPFLACWMGESEMSISRSALAKARIPVFRTPEPAVEAFSYVAAYYRNQQLSMQTPGPLAHQDAPDVDGGRILIESALAERRRVLNEMESKALLAAFHIPVTHTVLARSANEAIVIAEQIGFPVVLKINSPDIAHKSEIGCVQLNLTNAIAVRNAYNEIISQAKKHHPKAQIDGVSIQPMCIKAHGRELRIGVMTDPVFGPVITFGASGRMVELLNDHSVALPPLNQYLTNTLIQRTKIAKALEAYNHLPPVDMAALESVLLRVSEMVCELPWLRELEISPLIVDENGALAVDARVVVQHAPRGSNDRYSHMAIHPYPNHLVKMIQLPDGADVTLRPIRPEDAEIEQEFVRNLSDEAKYFRFMDTMHELTHKMLIRFTQIDYDREMAIIAVTMQDDSEVQIGVSRYVINPDGESCEFALAVADDWGNRGIGSRLMMALFEAARDKGLKIVEGDVLTNNRNMLKLMHALGFSISTSEDDPAVKRVIKVL